MCYKCVLHIIHKFNTKKYPYLVELSVVHANIHPGWESYQRPAMPKAIATLLTQTDRQV